MLPKIYIDRAAAENNRGYLKAGLRSMWPVVLFICYGTCGGGGGRWALGAALGSTLGKSPSYCMRMRMRSYQPTVSYHAGVL